MTPVEMPVVGDTVMFLSAGFRVYDDFPSGSPVGPHVTFVDCLDLFVVGEVRYALYALPRPRGGRRRRRGPPPPDQLLVAVRLTSRNGTILWTIFSKGEHPRMEVVDPSMTVV
jgi:hypothetical protein